MTGLAPSVERSCMIVMANASTMKTAMAFAMNWNHWDAPTSEACNFNPMQPGMMALALLQAVVSIAMATACSTRTTTRFATKMKSLAAKTLAACNYDATATDAGYCDYAETNYDCSGNCLNDSDQDGICDEFEVPAAPTARLATMIQPPRTTTLHARMQLLVSIAMATVWLIQTNDQICDQDEITGCQDDTACNYDCNSHGCGLLRLCRNELRLRRQLLERLRSRRHLQ